MATLTIPLVTLPAGAHDFGPGNAADSETLIVLTIDRTVAGGLNTLDGATAVEIDVFQSNDGGSSWFLCVGGSIPGGVLLDHGATIGTNRMNVGLYPGTSRKLKATVTVSGPSSVAVAGTLVTT